MSTGPIRRLDRFVEFAADSFWLVVLAFLGLYVTTIVLGGLSPIDVGGASVAAAIALVLFGAHQIRQNAHREEILHDRRLRSARERRGF